MEEYQIVVGDLWFLSVTLGMLGLKILILWNVYKILVRVNKRMKQCWEGSH